MVWALVLFIVGIILIFKGGDFFVDAAGWVSDVTGISKVVIGATIVSFATTAPEYFVSLLATLKGFNDLAVGNAVGSLICNIGVAFALLAICTPGKAGGKQFAVRGSIMIIATALLWLFCINGIVSAVEGIVLFAVFALFTLYNIKFSKEDEKTTRKPTNSKEIALNIAKFVGGAAAILLGSNLIVDNAQYLAAQIGIPESIVGLTVVAVGTSLPEIVTSVAAIIKRQSSLSIGNIVGANILDATLILATSSFVSADGLSVSAATSNTDLPAALIIMILAVLPTAIGKKVYRWQGFMIAGVYMLYLAFIVFIQ